MPYEGNSPIEAWEYWFDEPPSDAVRLCLEQRGKKHPVKAIIEAIAITASRVPLITEEDNRLRYMSGILRRETIRKIDPQRADEEHKIDILRTHWCKQEAGDFLAPRDEVREWLHWATLEEITTLMNISDDWSDLEALMRNVVERGRQETAAATAELTAEIEQAAQKLAIDSRRLSPRS